MIVLLQRVNHAAVSIEGNNIAEIGLGILAFVAIEPEDHDDNCQRTAQKILHYRIFADDEGKMNRSVINIAGEVLVVSQFTLAADTRHGMRPGFSTAATPHHAKSLFEKLFNDLTAQYPAIKKGRFGTSMQVTLTNDGPATFLLKT